MPATISTRHYLLDQARRRFTPSINNFPGMGLVEHRLLKTQFPEHKLADPPPGSGLEPVLGDAGAAVRRAPHRDDARRTGLSDVPLPDQGSGRVRGLHQSCPGSRRWARTQRRSSTSNRNKDYSQQGWVPVIGPFFNRGLMLLDFDEHMFHRRIMQEAFVRSRLVGYVEQMDKVVSQVIANDWVANDARFLLYPAMKELTLDIASMVFMGR